MFKEKVNTRTDARPNGRQTTDHDIRLAGLRSVELKIKALSLPVSEKKILKLVFFVPMFQLVTRGVRLVLTQGASYEQTW